MRVIEYPLPDCANAWVVTDIVRSVRHLKAEHRLPEGSPEIEVRSVDTSAERLRQHFAPGYLASESKSTLLLSVPTRQNHTLVPAQKIPEPICADVHLRRPKEYLS